MRGIPESSGDRLKPTRRLDDRCPGFCPTVPQRLCLCTPLGNPAEFYATSTPHLSGVTRQRRMGNGSWLAFWLKSQPRPVGFSRVGFMG